VLDEADRLLNMDYEEEIDQILACLPKVLSILCVLCVLCVVSSHGVWANILAVCNRSATRICSRQR
jgi:superfamily II DNA/RNA helicase